MLTTPPDLAPFLGKNISEICPFLLGKDNGTNHCAHFISHIMEYEFDHTCKNQNFAEKHAAGKGANIRVNEIFNACPDKGAWTSKRSGLLSCLMFVTISSNIEQSRTGLIMKNNPSKHVGIFADGQVWNYSNGHKKVVVDAERVFLEKFKHAYRTTGNTVEFYYGNFLK